MFKFTFDEKEYILDDENFDELINDDEKPVKNIDKDTILQLLNESSQEINFGEEFYIEACPKCLTGIKEKATDIDYSKKITVTDLSMMNQALVGKINL